MVGGVVGVIEFGAINAEELEVLVEVSFCKLGWQELGELGKVD
ncbi:hypothetical protein [Microcoleus sp.]